MALSLSKRASPSMRAVARPPGRLAAPRAITSARARRALCLAAAANQVIIGVFQPLAASMRESVAAAVARVCAALRSAAAATPQREARGGVIRRALHAPWTRPLRRSRTPRPRRSCLTARPQRPARSFPSSRRRLTPRRACGCCSNTPSSCHPSPKNSRLLRTGSWAAPPRCGVWGRLAGYGARMQTRTPRAASAGTAPCNGMRRLCVACSRERPAAVGARALLLRAGSPPNAPLTLWVSAPSAHRRGCTPRSTPRPARSASRRPPTRPSPPASRASSSTRCRASRPSRCSTPTAPGCARWASAAPRAPLRRRASTGLPTCWRP